MQTDTFGAFSMTTETEAQAEPFAAAPTPPPPPPGPDHAQQLRHQSAAVAVSFTWMGVRKSLTTEQRHEIATSFEAEKDFVSAGKKLLNTRHPKFRALTRIKNQITQHWKDHSLPFPEPGIRLIRREKVEDFQAQMEAYKDDLATAVADLESSYHGMKTEARERLGSLYNPADYPETMTGLFTVAWTFPNVEPPSYLMQLQPAVYEAERARVAQQFEESVRLAEASFIEQFEHLITHICERLEKGEDGRPKTFQSSTIENLTDFFERFKALNVGSNERLDALVKQAQDAVKGATPTRLRNQEGLRASLRSRLDDVARDLTEMMIEKPRRKILRPTRPQQGDQS